MKNLIKSLLVFAGIALGTETYAQAGMNQTNTADSTTNRSKGKMQNNQMHSDTTMHRNTMDRQRSDSMQMNDGRRNPSNMPQDTSRNRNRNDKMMQRDSLK